MEGLIMMKHDKEYEKLYEQYKHSGFEFGYSTRIGKSKIIYIHFTSGGRMMSISKWGADMPEA